MGAESTGTTTVSQAVAAALRARAGVWATTAWVGEYGREYTVGRLVVAAAQAIAAGRPAWTRWSGRGHKRAAAGAGGRPAELYRAGDAVELHPPLQRRAP